MAQSNPDQPNPYLSWSWAPKHWAEIPLPRVPASVPARVHVSARVTRARSAGVAVGLTVVAAVLLVAVIGQERSVAGLDGPGPGAVGTP
ncbi:hypothetical protein GCM10009609_31440 [Pseudonocardia aurantiaca]|uniref:Uncharacterized protein n=1 Tax=Pseudonocardia aurantiaca TaxID=75290 RepID=A0ABW4FUE1_9PSEU